MCRTLNFICYFIFFLSSSLAFALPTDSQQKIHITADSTLVDYKTGSNTHEGNVKVDQGSTHLIADRLTTTNNAKHKMEEAIAYGTTRHAEYSTTPKEGDAVFTAKAKTIKFYPQKATVVLEGDVTVTQGENSFQGQLIIYNTKDQVVTAPASKGGRATIVIEPDHLKL